MVMLISSCTDHIFDNDFFLIIISIFPQQQSWGRLHANVIDYNYNYFEIS